MFYNPYCILYVFNVIVVIILVLKKSYQRNHNISNFIIKMYKSFKFVLLGNSFVVRF